MIGAKRLKRVPEISPPFFSTSRFAITIAPSGTTKAPPSTVTVLPTKILCPGSSTAGACNESGFAADDNSAMEESGFAGKRSGHSP
jgi:hypothetical protein